MGVAGWHTAAGKEKWTKPLADPVGLLKSVWVVSDASPGRDPAKAFHG